MTTTLSISEEAKAVGVAMAKTERRSLSGQIEILILEEARRRGLEISRTSAQGREEKHREVSR